MLHTLIEIPIFEYGKERVAVRPFPYPEAIQRMLQDEKYWLSQDGGITIDKNYFFKVTFIKKDGSLRVMYVKKNEELLKPKSEVTPGLVARRETNRIKHNMVVTEYLPESGEYQVRTIPLQKVTEITVVGIWWEND